YLLPAKDKVCLSNWTHPSIEDYKIIQNYLANAPRPELKYVNFPESDWREKRIRNFKIITENQNPEFHIKFFNNDPFSKENCIVTYISFNEFYRESLNDLIEQLNTLGFNGHLIYRIGGWPNTEDHSLELFDVPYVFKIFSILEAQKLGYKNCLWLDACFYPLQSLNPIFQHIAKNGVFFHSDPSYDSAGLIQEFATLALENVSLSDFLKLTAVSTTAIGLDLKSKRGKKVLEKWHRMAKNKLGFLSYIPEMASWYILANCFQLLPYADSNFIAYSKKDISLSTLLYWNHVGLNAAFDKKTHSELFSIHIPSNSPNPNP
ncbi:MAG TPA: hypothetical protein VMR37_05465, partial [Rhabdochlamydiaceae bacterium]|nr:hypothetical protein [Rhabdochlamydiaceae bacterium]